MKCFALLLVILTTSITYARQWSCAAEIFVRPEERLIADWLHRMHQLKAERFSAEILTQLEELNSRLLNQFTLELKSRGYAYKVTPEATRLLLDSSANFDGPVPAVQGLRGFLPEARTTHRERPNQPLLHRRPSWNLAFSLLSPNLIVTNGPELSGPHRLAELATCFPDLKVMLSPHQRSAFPEMRASTIGTSCLFYGIEHLMHADFGRGRLLNHEIDHLMLTAAENDGEETLYGLELDAQPGFRIPGSDDGVYDEHLSMQELFAWGNDVEELQRPDTLPDRHFSNGLVFVEGDFAVVEYERAERLRKIGVTVERAITYATDFVRRRSIEVDFQWVSDTRSSASLPWYSGGQHVSEIDINVVHGPGANRADKLNALRSYLPRLNESTQRHLREARAVLKRYGYQRPPGRLWVQAR